VFVTPVIWCDADSVESMVKQKMSALLSFEAESLPDKVKLGCVIS
jgi:hypothetical protein